MLKDVKQSLTDDMTESTPIGKTESKIKIEKELKIEMKIKASGSSGSSRSRSSGVGAVRIKMEQHTIFDSSRPTAESETSIIAGSIIAGQVERNEPGVSDELKPESKRRKILQHLDMQGSL